MTASLEVWTVAQATSRVILKTEMLIEAPNWSPDGSYLLINGDGQLYRVPLGDPAMHRVDTGAASDCNNDHGITPDGQTYIVSSDHGGLGSEIYLIPADGGTAEKISSDHPSWWHGVSPDGRTLAFVGARGERKVIDVYVQPLGGSERRLTNGEGHCDGPDYSPDGKSIYYNCDRDGHAQIWVMDADGANQRKLFADAFVNWFPHPSPCGAHVLYLAYPPGTLGHPRDLPVSLCLMNPDGSNRRKLLSFNGGQGSINVPCWSPDGAEFAFVRYD